MKYYYSLGVRDFADELGYGTTLLLQHYVDTGDEECLEVIFRYGLRGSPAYNQERYNFYKEIYKWNSTLNQKIRLHSFDVEHGRDLAVRAIFFYILRKYPKIEDIPYVSAWGSIQEFVDDFKNNKARYSSISSEDMKLFERIIANIEQGLNYYASQNDTMREQYMIGNFREIIKDTKGRKVFATMGANHASLNGVSEDDNGKSFGPGFTMASVIKNEKSIASIVLRRQANTDRWQYIIRIDESKKTTPYNSTYEGNWPWNLAW